MTFRAFVASLAFVAACEVEPPRVDLAVDLGQDAAPDLSERPDLARADDLAPHVIALPPPTALSVEYERTAHGAVANVRFVRPTAASRVRVLRRAVELPAGPFDALATLVYEGESDTATHAIRQLVALETSNYAAFSCDDAGGCEDAGVQVPFAVTVTQALADGGYTIYVRHAEDGICADALALGPALTTTSPGWWRSCERACGAATASQLTDGGATLASQLGDTMRTRAIPVGRVHASEYCRATATAELLALGPLVERDPDLTYFVYDESRRCATTEARIATPPPPGQNTVLVGHAGFEDACEPLQSLAFLGSALYRPTPQMSGHARFIQLLSPLDWATVP